MLTGREEGASDEMSLSESDGKRPGEQRPPMWPELSVYHARGQWVTYFRECSFIRARVYKPPAPTAALFVLADVRQPVAFNSGFFFCFQSGGRSFLTRSPRVLHFQKNRSAVRLEIHSLM